MHCCNLHEQWIKYYYVVAASKHLHMDTDDLFWGNPPDKEKLDSTLQKIIGNIERIKKIPSEK